MKFVYNEIGVEGKLVALTSVPVCDEHGNVLYTRVELVLQVDPPKEK